MFDALKRIFSTRSQRLAALDARAARRRELKLAVRAALTLIVSEV